jgi:DNA topoisomerase-3
MSGSGAIFILWGGIRMSVLVIAEKPSVSRSLAAVLGANTSKEGCFEGNGYIVSYCYGHLLELAAPEAYGDHYAKWRYADLPIVPQAWKHVPAKDKTAQLKILKELLNRPDVEYVINACDAGPRASLSSGLSANTPNAKSHSDQFAAAVNVISVLVKHVV